MKINNTLYTLSKISLVEEYGVCTEILVPSDATALRVRLSDYYTKYKLNIICSKAPEVILVLDDKLELEVGDIELSEGLKLDITELTNPMVVYNSMDIYKIDIKYHMLIDTNQRLANLVFVATSCYLAGRISITKEVETILDEMLSKKIAKYYTDGKLDINIDMNILLAYYNIYKSSRDATFITRVLDYSNIPSYYYRVFLIYKLPFLTKFILAVLDYIDGLCIGVKL